MNGDTRNGTIRKERFENVATEHEALGGVGADADEEEIGPEEEKADKTAVHGAQVGVDGT